jgi:hypothetical protein
MKFNFAQCTPEDRETALRYIGSLDRPADVVIGTDVDYLWRWHVVKRAAGETVAGNVYFHIQTASDPERPLHDHPWDNMSLILAGEYIELVQHMPPWGETVHYKRVKGQTIFRPQQWAHRLILPRHVRYTMTQFTTGAYKRDWGFWIGKTWHPHAECTRLIDGRSVWVDPPKAA